MADVRSRDSVLGDEFNVDVLAGAGAALEETQADQPDPHDPVPAVG
jgi:hypothetical protein